MKKHSLTNTTSRFFNILASVASFAFIVLVILIILFFSFIRIGQDKSLPYTIFIKDYSKSNFINSKYKPNSSDFVLFKLSHETVKDHPYLKDKSLIKQVGCSSGNFLEILEDRVLCNNRLISKFNNEYKSINKSIKKFSFKGIIPDNKIFVIGVHDLSYDSKYFGLIDVSSISDYLIPMALIFKSSRA